jgi:hypothetical protein
MLSWKTNLFLIALGLMYPIVMLIKDLNKKKRDEKTMPKSGQKKCRTMNEIANICLFNTLLFGLGYITGFAKRFPDLWSIMPLCIGVFLVSGILLKIIAISTRKK